MTIELVTGDCRRLLSCSKCPKMAAPIDLYVMGFFFVLKKVLSRRDTNHGDFDVPSHFLLSSGRREGVSVDRCIQVLEGFKVFLQYFHIWKIDNALWRPCFLSDWHNLYNFCTQALEEQFGENQIEIGLLVLEKKIFKDFVHGCHGNKGHNSAQ